MVWTSLGAVQETVGQDYVIMWRQKASDVVFPDDVETIRRDLEQGCKQLQGFHAVARLPTQIVLRELQTLSGHPDRRPREARELVDAGCDRNGGQVRLNTDRGPRSRCAQVHLKTHLLKWRYRLVFNLVPGKG